MRIGFLYSFLCCLIILPQFAIAAEIVMARFNKQAEYERLVLEWKGAAPEYSLDQSASMLSLKFTSGFELNASAITGADSAFINSVDILSPTEIEIGVNPYTDIRDIRVDNKLVIDIYGNAEDAEKAKKAQEDLPPANAQSQLEKDIEKMGADNPALEIQDAEEAQSILKTNAELAAVKTPIAFVMSSSDGIKIAAYERFGFLWVLTNHISLPIEPYLEGENKDILASKITKHLVADGTATLWQIERPEGFHVSGEGGSLYWRLVISPSPHKTSTPPIQAVRQVSTTEDGREGGAELAFELDALFSTLRITDPLAGDEILAVLSDSSEVYNDSAFEYVDFKQLKSPVGFAFQVINPDLEAKNVGGDLVISAPEGLSIGILKKQVERSPTELSQPSKNSLFNFDDWKMGPKSAMLENERLLLTSVKEGNQSQMAQRLVSLAKLNLAHGFGAEAKGFASYASDIMNDLERSPPFIALRGAAAHVAFQHDTAIRDLSHPALKQFDEIKLWRAVTLAHLGDWRQAIETLPTDFSVLENYPIHISAPLTLSAIEIALRNGDIETAEELIAYLGEKSKDLREDYKTGIKYLSGEILRQKKEDEEAISIWSKISKQEDPYYRTKSELSLVSMGLDNETIKADEAMDRLENLRFVWRGDDLEIQVLRRLGLSEIEAQKYLNGFKTLRDTVVLSQNNSLSDQVTKSMMETYEDIFLTNRIETITPIDAVMLYEEFRELTPTGEKGDRLIARLAERLVDADLFERATKLLAYQLDYRLTGEEAISIALRMASIQLMDRRPNKALETLRKAETLLRKSEFPNKALKAKDLKLLRARALSESGDVSGALRLLEDMVPSAIDISRLEADIAWKAERWDAAADALRELVLMKDFSSEENLNEEDAKTLLNYAVSLNLSDQRITLRNIRERHLKQMADTPYGERFEVVTRPRQDTMLSDRGSILDTIGETEIFEDFLESYNKVE